MSFRIVLLVSVVLAVLCALFVEWTAPKFKAGDLVCYESPYVIYRVERAEVPDVKFELTGYRVRLFDPQYRISKRYDPDYSLLISESELFLPTVKQIMEHESAWRKWHDKTLLHIRNSPEDAVTQ